MLAFALPKFRTIEEKVNLDIDRIKSLGITINENHPVDHKEYNELRENFDYIYVATGARVSRPMGAKGEKTGNVQGFLEFLKEAKTEKLTSLEGSIAVVGGGNSAIDTVRTAKRLSKDGSKVTLLYRRTVEQMPASREEIEELLEEKIDVMELVSPLEVISQNDKIKSLKLQKMVLTEKDSSGRIGVKAIDGSDFDFEVNYLIYAIGQDTELSFLDSNIRKSKKGLVEEKHQWAEKGKVLVGGDAMRGPASIIKGIADGKHAAYQILYKENIEAPNRSDIPVNMSHKELRLQKSQRVYGKELPKSDLDSRDNFNVVVQTMSKKDALEEASRCLQCDQVCDICVTVCPNRANYSYQADCANYNLKDISIKNGRETLGDDYSFSVNQKQQVLNIGNFCNECGNCKTFCPTSGKPYEDKPKLYITKEAFDQEKNNAFFIKTMSILAKVDGQEWRLTYDEENLNLFTGFAKIELTKDLDILNMDYETDGEIDMSIVATMHTLKTNLKENLI